MMFKGIKQKHPTLAYSLCRRLDYVYSLKIKLLHFFSLFIFIRIVSWILKMLLWFLLMKLYIPLNYGLHQVMAPMGVAGTLIFACLLFLCHRVYGM